MERGSFDAAAAGCSIIFHTASPFTTDVQDPDKDLIEPAVRGTENVLTTASQTPSVQRVVLTSSCAAVYGHAADLEQEPNQVWTEESWNRSSSRTDQPYSLSKTLAEMKAWVIAGSQTQWKLVVVNPTLVMGPGLKYHAASESYKWLIQLGGGGAMATAGVPDFPMGIVDVRDVAAAHVAAAYLKEAAGRYICNGSNTSFPAMAAALRAKYPPPKYPVPTRTLWYIPKRLLWLLAPYVDLSRTFVQNNLGLKMNFDTSKIQKELGMEFLSLETTLQDMYQQLLDEKVIEPKEG